MKKILITGGSGALGQALVRVFAQAGYWVAYTFFRSEQCALDLHKELSEQGYACMALKTDLQDGAAIERMNQHILKQFGHLDVFIHNAGVCRYGLLQELPDEHWQEMMQVHLHSLYRICRFFLPAMSQQGQGSILPISSVWGITGASCEVAYSTAKAAMIGFTKSLAKEVGPSGIRVNCLAPGVIDTPMMKNFTEQEKQALCDQTPLGRFATPQEIARLAFYLVDDPSSFLTGQVISPNGGLVM